MPVSRRRGRPVSHDVIGVGKATLGEDIDVAVSSLRGITFDGTQLRIPRDVIIEAQ